MVIGTGPYDFIARALSQADRDRRLRAARRAARRCGWCSSRSPRAAAKSRTSTGAIVPEDGNAPALAAIHEVFELREFFEWRGLGSIDHSGVRVRDAYARFDAERKFPVPNLKIADPKSCQCGEVLKGVIKPRALQGVRHGLHAGDAARRADGVVRRRVRGLLQLRAHRYVGAAAQARQAAGMNDVASGNAHWHAVAAAIRRRSGRVRDATINLAHGGGGKAMRDLIEDVFVGAFDNPALARSRIRRVFPLAELVGARRPAGVHHRLLRGRSAVLSRRRHRHAGRVRARSTISRWAARGRSIFPARSCSRRASRSTTLRTRGRQHAARGR